MFSVEYFKSGGGNRGQGPLVVVFAEVGPLAGDLAAMLSGRFRVQRTSTVPGVRAALDQPADALIIVEGESLPSYPELVATVTRSLGGSCRILVLGGEPARCPASWAGRVVFLKALPDPAQLIRALQDIPLREARGEN